MDDLQDGTSAAPSAPGAPENPESDPKPVFQGDWNTSTGTEKGLHAEAVRQWKLRQGLKVGGRMGATSSQPVSRTTDGDAFDPANRQVLMDIRDDPRALASDRIRATQALLQLERGAEVVGSDSDLVALRAVLETLRPEERLAWLQGERLAQAQGVGA